MENQQNESTGPKNPVQQPKTNIDTKVQVSYLSAFYLLVPIIIGVCLLLFSSLGAWKTAVITIVLLLIAGILIYHKYIVEEFDKLKAEYLQELHNVHNSIFEMETNLRNDLSAVINDMLTKANDEFAIVLKQIHDDIHGQEKQVGELTNTIGEKVKKVEDNTVVKEIETGKD